MKPHAFAITERHTGRDYWQAPIADHLPPNSGGYTSPFNIRRSSDGRLYLSRMAKVFPQCRGVQFVYVRRAGSGDAETWHAQVYKPAADEAEFIPQEDWAPREWPDVPGPVFIYPISFDGEWR